MSNPEDTVLAVIDELIDEALAAGERSGGYVWCPHCGSGWHGLPEDNGCPGSTASAKDVPAGVRRRERRELQLTIHIDHIQDAVAAMAQQFTDMGILFGEIGERLDGGSALALTMSQR